MYIYIYIYMIYIYIYIYIYMLAPHPETIHSTFFKTYLLHMPLKGLFKHTKLYCSAWLGNLTFD